jgi:hypothetical protein
MMAACEVWLHQQDVPKLNLMVRGENLSVRAFYDAMGYAHDDVVVYSHRLTDTYLRPPRSALLLIAPAAQGDRLSGLCRR